MLTLNWSDDGANNTLFCATTLCSVCACSPSASLCFFLVILGLTNVLKINQFVIHLGQWVVWSFEQLQFVFRRFIRSFLEEILYKTMMEIRAGGTFNSLAEAIKKEKDSKLKMEEIITKYDFCLFNLFRLNLILVAISHLRLKWAQRSWVRFLTVLDREIYSN